MWIGASSSLHICIQLQTWRNNMSKAEKEVVKSSKDDYTKVTFKPDLARFKMKELDKDTVSLLTRRAYDIAGCTKGVKVYLNGKHLPVRTQSTNTIDDILICFVDQKLSGVCGIVSQSET